jgi:lipopolysaccharide transport system permease protein
VGHINVAVALPTGETKLSGTLSSELSAASVSPSTPAGGGSALKGADLAEGISNPSWHVDGANPPPALNLRELWAYRELLVFLTNRDLKLRYKQTLLGAGWAVAQPLVQMGVMTIVLGYVAGLRNKTAVPYAVLTFTALVPWQLFASALNNASNSLVGNERLVTKVYFPRLIIPAAAILARLVDFVVCLGVLALMMALYIVNGTLELPSPMAVVMLPLYTAWALLLAFGAGLYFSSLNVRWRDIGHIVPFLMQIMMWVSGVYLASNIIPEYLTFYYHLNPIANIIDGFRNVLLHQAAPPLIPALISLAGTFVVVYMGLRYFRHAEETFADVI